MISSLKSLLRPILLKIQHKIKLDVFYIARGGFWITLSYFIGALLSLASSIAFANFLPKEIFGVYKYALTIIGTLTVFSLSGMGPAISRAVARGHEGVLLTAVRRQLKWNLGFVLATLGTAIYYYLNDNSIIALSLLVLGLTIPAARAFTGYGSFLEGKKNFQMLFVLDFIFSFFSTVSLIAATYLTDNPVILISVYGLTSLISSLVGYTYIIKKYKPTKTTAQEDHTALQFGTHLSFLSALGIIAQQADKILIFRYSGAVELAMYSIAGAIPDRLKSLAKSLSSMAFPKLSQKTKAEINRTLPTRMLQGAALGALLSLGYISVAPYFFKFFLPQYLDSIIYSQLLSLVVIVLIPHFYIGYAIHSQKMIKAAYISGIGTTSIKLGSYLIFGMLWGVQGIVAARISVYFLTFILSIILWYSSTETGNIDELPLSE